MSDLVGLTHSFEEMVWKQQRDDEVQKFDNNFIALQSLHSTLGKSSVETLEALSIGREETFEAKLCK